MDGSDEFDRLYELTNNSGVYRAAVHAAAPGLPAWLTPFSCIDETVLELIAQELHLAAGQTFLDLACGTGGTAVWLAERTGASVIGIDHAPAAIRAALRLATQRAMSERAQFLVADAGGTGLPDRSLSAAICIDALMFMAPERVAAELSRLLEPGGIFIATAAESLVEPFMPTLVRDYRPIYRRAGFTIRRHEENPGHSARQLALYRAIDERADDLRAELGAAADSLIDEARDGLQRASRRTERVRHVLLVAESTSS